MSSATGYSIIPNWLSKWAGCDSQKKIFAFDLATKKSELGYTAHDGTKVPPQCSYMSISYIAKSCGITDKVAQRFIREVFEASKGRMSRGKDWGNKKPFFYWISDDVGGSEGEVTGDKSNTVSTNTVKPKSTSSVSVPVDGYTAEFEEIWKLGWQGGKKPCFKAYKKLTKNVPPAVLYKAALAYMATSPKHKFALYNWLNQGHYESWITNETEERTEPTARAVNAGFVDWNKIEESRRRALDRKYQDTQGGNGLSIS